MALVVFLKGVNVGGHRKVRPSEIARQLKRYDVVNIGAAGTFVVRKPVSQTKLRDELTRRLPFAAEIMISTGDSILRLAAADPFIGEPADRSVMQFVSVRAKKGRASTQKQAKPSVPQGAPATPLVIPTTGDWELRLLHHGDEFLIGVCRRQMKAIGRFGKLEKIFGSATTRSWSTILKIARVLEETGQLRPSPGRPSRPTRSKLGRKTSNSR